MSPVIPDNSKRDQAIVIASRYGMSYAAIGKLHGISRSRVNQIVDWAKRKPKTRTLADELTTRIRNALRNEGCQMTPADIAQRFTLRDLKRVPNLGVTSIAELNAWLVRHGQEPIT
jgi:DNA-binding transcriptional regulator YdaS (Cro superfamily)